MSSERRILLVDPDEGSREGLATRLRTLGYEVVTAQDGAQGAEMALENPPHAVIADLFMPSISGAQLCRLLTAEPATSDVPVILRGPDAHRNRYWAEQTRAQAYVIKGRMGDLVRAITRGIAESVGSGGSIRSYPRGASDVRDRIAHYLDAALFQSVIAAEVRNLASCESFDRLFDLFAQFASQVASYRWLCVLTEAPARAGLHARPGEAKTSREEAFEVLGLTVKDVLLVEDEDALAKSGDTEQPPIVSPIVFGEQRLGALALAPLNPPTPEDLDLFQILARELGGPLRTAALVEESRRLARHDALTGLFNRRAFVEAATREVARAQRHGDPLAVLLLDIDHFKRINDSSGHAVGDRVLKAIGMSLTNSARRSDVCARWGGEEFVMLLPSTRKEGAQVVAERTRRLIEELHIENDQGVPVGLSASIGLAMLKANDSLDSFIDRSDKAMYAAKTAGRNRVAEQEPTAGASWLPLPLS